MHLDTPSKLMEVKLGEVISTAECDFTSAWADHTETTFTPAGADGVTTSVTAVTVVDAPAAGRVRQVKEITVCNTDTIAHTVILQLNSGGTRRVVQQKDLAVGESYVYRPDALQGPAGAAGATGASAGSTGTPADFGLFFEGRSAANQEIYRMLLTKAIVLPVALSGSKFSANVNPTADWTCTLYKNGVSIGTLTFVGGSATVTVVFATQTTFNIADKFEIVGDTSEDATLKDITFAFAAVFA